MRFAHVFGGSVKLHENAMGLDLVMFCTTHVTHKGLGPLGPLGPAGDGLGMSVNDTKWCLAQDWIAVTVRLSL